MKAQLAIKAKQPINMNAMDPVSIGAEAVLIALATLADYGIRSVHTNNDGDVECRKSDGCSVIINKARLPKVVLVPIESAECT